MSGYNERKLSVLEALEDLGEARAREVADYVGITEVNARQVFSRYHRQGLLNRRWGLYWLSNRGFERMEYLQSITQ